MSVHEQPWTDGTPCWAELSVPDLELGRRFYGGVLGWEWEIGPAETGFYSQGLVGGRPAAALSGPMPGESSPTVWTTFLATSDVQATTDRAVAAGAQVVLAPAPVMEFGSMAVLTDPTGALVALWQANRMIGAQVANEPGAMIWNEHMSDQFGTATEFYRTVFGYELAKIEVPGLEYVTLNIGGHEIGGAGSGSPTPHWALYFAVADVDAACATAERLGGSVSARPEDTEFGRQAGITGPFGEKFWLISTDEPSSPPKA